jgi:hypothetical protein
MLQASSVVPLPADRGGKGKSSSCSPCSLTRELASGAEGVPPPRNVISPAKGPVLTAFLGSVAHASASAAPTSSITLVLRSHLSAISKSSPLGDTRWCHLPCPCWTTGGPSSTSTSSGRHLFESLAGASHLPVAKWFIPSSGSQVAGFRDSPSVEKTKDQIAFSISF